MTSKGEPRVALVATEGEVYRALARAVELAGGLSVAGKQVFVKPNLWRPAPSGSGHITSKEVLAAVVRLVLESGAAQVLVGDGAAVGYYNPRNYDTGQVFKEGGFLDALKDLPVEFVDLNRDRFVEIKLEEPSVLGQIKIARSVLEAEYLLNLPVLKTHIRTGVSLGMKNLKGVMPGGEKRRSHMVGLEEAILELNKVLRPDFNIVDGTTGMQGLWEHPRDSVPVNLVIAGQDIYAVDVVGAQVMGIDPEGVYHLRLASQRGWGEPQAVHVVGEEISRVKVNFLSSMAALGIRYPGVTLFMEGACTGCSGSVTGALHHLARTDRIQELGDLVIVSGQGDFWTTEGGRGCPGRKVVFVGNCVKEQVQGEAFVSGCPPTEGNIFGLLQEWLEKRK